MWKIEYGQNPYSRRLTEQQREFADNTLRKLAACKDPKNYSDDTGQVKPLLNNRAGEHSFKPSRNLRNLGDMEIRIIFLQSDKLCRILVKRVAPRDEVYK